jgi:uncharacterized NAD(P)/FAD-binding protein YdhS
VFKTPIIKIAIIGGGPAGVSLCLQLVQALEQTHNPFKVLILLFEAKSELGTGLPYGFLEDSFCINLPKQYMTLLPGQYHHFADWVSSEGKQDRLFPPRHYFGQYAQEQLAAIKSTEHYEVVFHRDHHVVNIKPLNKNQYGVEAIQHDELFYYEADYLLLATGHLPNTSFSHLRNTPCQINPWNLNHYQTIHPHSHVGIVGTRLTAIDVVLKLMQQNHQGKISLMSRSGLLSAVRGEHSLPEMNYLTPKNILHIVHHTDSRSLLPALIKLLEQEFIAFLPSGYTLWNTLKAIKRQTPLQRLQREIRQAELKQTSWQSVLSCFYQILFKLWPKIHPTTQAHFLKNYRSLLLTWLCSFPLEKAYLLHDSMLKGQLTIHKELLDIEHQSSSFILHGQQKVAIECEHLILALGSGNEPETIPLLAQMLQQGLITKHQLGGLSIQQSTYQVHNKQSLASSRIYALGDLVKGACFNTIELGQVVEQAHLIIQHLMTQLRSSYSPSLS